MPTFSDILGQPQAVDVLQRAAEGNRLAGAYLFAGPEGVGKATCAKVLAAALNCETAPGVGCHDPDRCSSCHKFQQDLHPDLVRLIPEKQYIKIDQVRAVEELLAFPPHEGRHRLVLIDGADRLNTNAANALLKSVEEPRPRTLFVLVTAAAHRVTPTLVSRCQRVRFVPLERDVVLSILSRQEEVDADEAQMQAAAGYCEGSAGRALRLLDGEQFATLEQMVEGLVEAARGDRAVQVFDLALEAGRDRQVITDALDLLRLRLRDALLGQTPGDDGSHLSVDAILGQLQAVDEAQSAVRGNVHATLALENLVLSMRECGARK